MSSRNAVLTWSCIPSVMPGAVSFALCAWAQNWCRLVPVSGVMALRLRFDMPRLRSPSGAPVPVGAPPTSRITAEGAMKSTICQRSILPVNPPSFASIGGGGRSTIQRTVRTPRGVRSVAAGVSATPISPSVVGCTKGRCDKSRRLSISS